MAIPSQQNDISELPSKSEEINGFSEVD